MPRNYPQAEPPDTFTCAVYVLAMLFFVSVTAYILARAFGVI